MLQLVRPHMMTQYTHSCSLYLVCKAPHRRTANENTFGTQGQRLQHIASCPDPSVQIDLDSALHRVHDL